MKTSDLTHTSDFDTTLTKLTDDQRAQASGGEIAACTIVAILWLDPATGEGSWVINHATDDRLKTCTCTVLADAAASLTERAAAFAEPVSGAN